MQQIFRLPVQYSMSSTVMECPSEELLSDCESGISGPNSAAAQTTTTTGRRLCPADAELTTVGEEDRIHQIIREKLLAGGCLSGASIEAVRVNAFSSMTKKAKLQAFEIFAKAVEKESGCCSDANVRYAWFGASIDDIRTVLSHGFLPCMIKDGIHGHGIYLSPDHFPLGSVKSAVADEKGVRHILLCRVILGKTEVVPAGSRQWLPSSGGFHSGVDDSVSPTNYIVWSTHMNTHILPRYLISFRLVSSSGEERIAGALQFRKPTSPWIPFTALLSALTTCLPPHTMRLIAENYREHRERKISRREMIERMREEAGDELLAAIIKAHRTKN